MEFITVPILLIAGAFFLYQTVIGKKVWCDNCNQWSKMTLQFSPTRGYVCPNCKSFNQAERVGCPKCHWYPKFGGEILSKKGPFRKIDRTSVTPFYGIQEEYMAYEVVTKCPHHGSFIAVVPADAFNSSSQNNYDESYDDYDF